MTAVAFADSARRLADLALTLGDLSRLDDVCCALESGKFTVTSGAASRSTIVGGAPKADACLRSLQKEWSGLQPPISGPMLALALRTADATASKLHSNEPRAQVVWTGPSVVGSFVRTTKEVCRELVASASKELLIVGYWLATQEQGDRIIDDLIGTIADKARSGVLVTLVLDERRRDGGLDNREVLANAWPAGLPLPRLLTWRLPLEDLHLKLHAKVIVVDRADALVTSANLTSTAFTRNIEMGLRISGAPALDIARHFDFLASQGIIQPYLSQET